MEIQENQQESSWSETESTESLRSSQVGFSGPLVSNKHNRSNNKSTRFNEDNDMVEITLDVCDDSVQKIRGGDSQTTLLATRLEKRPLSLSARLKHVSQELKHMTSFKTLDKVARTKSGATRALRGLRFMTKTVGSEGWSQVEKRFDELAVQGKLPKTLFSQCIAGWEIIDDLYSWCRDNPPPIHLFVISGDDDGDSPVMQYLHKFRMRNYNIMVAYSKASQYFEPATAATILWQWSSILKGEDLTGKHFNCPPDGPFDSWYGDLKLPLENPFSALDKSTSSENALEHKSAATQNAKVPIW